MSLRKRAQVFEKGSKKQAGKPGKLTARAWRVAMIAPAYKSMQISIPSGAHCGHLTF